MCSEDLYGILVLLIVVGTCKLIGVSITQGTFSPFKRVICKYKFQYSCYVFQINCCIRVTDSMYHIEHTTLAGYIVADILSLKLKFSTVTVFLMTKVISKSIGDGSTPYKCDSFSNSILCSKSQFILGMIAIILLHKKSVPETRRKSMQLSLRTMPYIEFSLTACPCKHMLSCLCL